MPRCDEEFEMPPGIASRVAVSIAVGVGWLIFLVVFLFFYASNFNVYQNLAVFIISILVVGAILGPMWAYWGIKYAKALKKTEKRKRK
jgi:hypothetical protein